MEAHREQLELERNHYWVDRDRLLNLNAALRGQMQALTAQLAAYSQQGNHAIETPAEKPILRSRQPKMDGKSHRIGEDFISTDNYGPPSRKPTRDCKNASTLVNIFEEIEQKNIIQPQHKLLEGKGCGWIGQHWNSCKIFHK